MKSNLNDIRKNDTLNDIPLLRGQNEASPEPFIGVSETRKSLPTFCKSLRRLLQELDHVQQSCRSVNLVDFPLGINVKSAAILPETFWLGGSKIIFALLKTNILSHICNGTNMMFLFPVGGCWWDM